MMSLILSHDPREVNHFCKPGKAVPSFARGLLLLILFLLLAGCDAGTPSSSSSLPATYGAADDGNLALLFLQRQNQASDLTGTWTTWNAGFSRDLTNFSAPQASRLTVSGQIQQGQSFTLTINASTLSGTISGQQLTLVGTVAELDFQPATWILLPSSQDVNQLSTAFSQAIVARKHLRALSALTDQTPPPLDSDPLTYTSIVQGAQSYLQRLQRQHDLVMSSNNPCGTSALALFNTQYPPDEGVFKLSNAEVIQDTPEQNAQRVANNSSLGQSLQGMQGAWQSVHATPVPQLPGLSSAWQLSQSEETQAVELAQEQLGALQRSLTTDEQTLANLKQNTQQLAADVQKLTQQHGC